MMTGQDVLVYTYAASVWWRCRSKTERAEGATFETITEKYRQAWVNGARADLDRSGLRLQLAGAGQGLDVIVDNDYSGGDI